MAEPAAEVERLRAIRVAIATGDMVQTSKFKDNEVSYFAANLDLLDRLIVDLEAQLAAAGGKQPTRMVHFSTSKGI
jgi:hypothetical protein